jgi:hypothetical protein
MKTASLAVLCAVAATACGSSSAKNDGGAGGTGGEVGGTGPLYPLAVGSHWIYQITDTDGTLSTEVVSVAAQELVGGTGPHADQMAFRVVTGTKINDPNGDLDWEAEVASPTLRIVRYRELSVGESNGNHKAESYWDPPRLRVDEATEHSTVTGQAWNEPAYTEYDIDYKTDADAGTTYIADGGITSDVEEDIWSVSSANERVTAGGATYVALHVRRVNKNTADAVKDFWFARGVGLVKESGNGKPTHELTSYAIAGQ